MGMLEGLAIAVLVVGVLGCMVVLAIRDARGQRPVVFRGRLYERRGDCVTVTCFGNLNDLPRLSDAPKPPTSTERS